MTGTLIDSNVILDLFEEDSEWVEWLEAMLINTAILTQCI